MKRVNSVEAGNVPGGRPTRAEYEIWWAIGRGANILATGIGGAIRDGYNALQRMHCPSFY